MKTFVFLFLFGFSFLFASAQMPTDIRGQIITFANGGYVGLAYARVELLFFDSRFPPGQQWRLIAVTTTDANGFYGFNNILPNFYSIGVNQAKTYNIQVLEIDHRYYTFQQLPQFQF